MFFKVTKVISTHKFVTDKQFPLNFSNCRLIQLKREKLFIHKNLETEYNSPSIINFDENSSKLHDLFKCYHSRQFDDDNEFTTKFIKIFVRQIIN